MAEQAPPAQNAKGDTLAPPRPKPERSNSGGSARSSNSNSSRRGHKSPGSSASVSRSNSHSSNGHRRKNTNTTTISGGTSLGGSKASGLASAAAPGDSSKALGRKPSTRKGPQPQRPLSATTDKSTSPTPSPTTSTATETTLRSLRATSSPPVDAMEAAVSAATKKHHETHGQDALSSLQRMISDLKSISPNSSQPGSRSTSGKQETQAPVSAGSATSTSAPVSIPGATTLGSEPVTIPTGSAASSTKLKADAPTFTPGSLRSEHSPNTSTSPIAATVHQNRQQPGNRRGSATASVSSPGYGQFPQAFAQPAGFIPGAGGYGHESVDFSQLAQHAEVFQHQQQLLAAQQLQLQLLQAQLVQQQMSTQQQRDQGFIAPRFQALAAQRAALQQQNQVQSSQLAEAQRLFEMHQQQQLLLAQQQAQQPPRSPPAVFEDDSPESTPQGVGPTGRPQLNPNFTFGHKRRDSSATSDDKTRRSEAAAGLGGLAARAHKRSGSQVDPAVEEQIELQRQIEALQLKQKALLGGKPPGLDLSGLSQQPGQRTAHRRSQSQMSTASVDPYGGSALSPTGEDFGSRLGRSFNEMGPPGSTIGNTRRHSHSQNAGNRNSGIFGEYVEDGGSISIPAGGFAHHRSGSRSGGFESGNWRVPSSGGGVNNSTADLASAQAQLQSLSQFRAAAGSGHAKMASFSFPNMLPNLLAATTLQNPSGQSSLWQQQQAFQMQLQQNAHGPQRKSLFAPYLPQASLPPLLNAGKLVVGILRVNKKNRSDAYVATDVLDADIYICGSKDRNRALEGDIVAIELLDVDEVWSTKKDKEEKKRKKEESYDIRPSAAKKLEKKKDDIEVEGQGLTLFEDEEVNDDTKPAYAGHVVAVVERMPGQLFSGQLGVIRPSSAATKEKQEAERREREGDKFKSDEKKAEGEPRPKIVWFKPTDKRVPLIAIPTEQAPADFIENPDAHANKLFVATIKRWPITSLHPFGTLVEELGPIGDTEVETSALLKDCNFPTEEFNDVAVKCLPPLPWSIPEREYEARLDLRDECVFTIDSASARDLDDALSIKTNDDGTYTVGVHVADVSYFVKANTALDRDARKRAASAYLVQRAVPMLPPLLSEELCSLVPNVERLAFSAFFVVDKEGAVLERSYRKSIIKSAAQLSYTDAEGVLAGKALDASKVKAKGDKIVESIRLLDNLAKKMRAKRVASGAMLANRARISFELDAKGKPVDCTVVEKNSAQEIVEEFMVLTNTSIAAVIANGLPEQALLRRHDAPIERRMAAFIERAKLLGYELDPTNAGTLQQSLDKITDHDAVFCLNILEKKTMPSARYFCTGMLDISKYYNWALNAPLYTHFTSPIRRYADVLVHRMLDACLSSPSAHDVKFLMDRDQVAKCAQQCNMKNQSARLAESQSAHLYLCMLVSDLSSKFGPVIRPAKVTAVYDQAFDVVIPEFALEKRVHVDKLPLENTAYDEHANVLSLYWKTQDVLSFLAKSADDEHLAKIKKDGKGAVDATSEQHKKSSTHSPLIFEGLRSTPTHSIQDITEFATLPVIITADMTKSPPVLVVYACNPYSAT